MPKLDRTVEIMTGDRKAQLDQVKLRGVTVQYGDTAAGLLANAGWVANADAVEVLRSINPETDVDDLHPGQVLKLPSHKSGARPKRFLVDEKKKGDLFAVIRRGEEAWRAQRDAARSRQSEAVVQACDSIAEALHAVGAGLEERLLVTSTASLVVLTQEAQRFGEIAPTLADRPASEPDQATLIELAENLRMQAGSLVRVDFKNLPLPHRPPSKGPPSKGGSSKRLTGGTGNGGNEIPAWTTRLAHCRVQVRTKTKRPGGQPGFDDVPGYQIWYVPMIYFGRSAVPLAGTLSPSNAELLPGRYAFWATKPNHDAQRLGVRKSYLVDKPSDVVELVVDGDEP